MERCENCDGEMAAEGYCLACGREVNPMEPQEDVDPRRKREEEIGDVKHDLDR